MAILFNFTELTADKKYTRSSFVILFRFVCYFLKDNMRKDVYVVNLFGPDTLK